LTITNAICYDLHYFDLALKLKNTDILLASVNDADFGRFMPYLHAKDIILRAIENRVNIGVSSTT
jgi:apolipoprotein N-acyltransferase